MNVIKNMLFLVAIAGSIGNITYSSNRTDISVWPLYDNSKCWHLYAIIKPTELFGIGKRIIYNKNAIIIRKLVSGKILVDTAEELLYETMNAFITQCPNFDIIEHGANKENKSLCNNPEIKKAYEEFKKQYQKK